MSNVSPGSPSNDEAQPTPTAGEEVDDAALRGAVIAGVVPGQSLRVLKEGARYARLHGTYLIVTYVDVTRFVTYEDPDGYVHSAPIDMNIDPGVGDFTAVTKMATETLTGTDVRWTARQLVGDPALAIKQLADRVEARLIVVGTRKRGIGESIREFFTGSVAARLAHRQRHNILVVPLGEPVPDDQELIWEE
ncbi:universal stress protein [Micromonospora sp. DT81.3]|uniref:universal stress protein n=1 Tax=Actinomycetes TaxID=1760 RepID=UPI003CF38678